MERIVFTRYLYTLEHVKVALLCSLLHGDEADAMFWTEEMMDSGFQEDWWEHMLQVFLDFYALGYLTTLKHVFAWLLARNKDMQDTIVTTLCEHCNAVSVDVFLFIQVCTHYVVDCATVDADGTSGASASVYTWIVKQDMRSLVNYVTELDTATTTSAFALATWLSMFRQALDAMVDTQGLRLPNNDKQPVMRVMESYLRQLPPRLWKHVFVAQILWFYRKTSLKTRVQVLARMPCVCEEKLTMAEKEKEKEKTLGSRPWQTLLRVSRDVNKYKMMHMFDVVKAQDLFPVYCESWQEVAIFSPTKPCPLWVQRWFQCEEDDACEQFHALFDLEPDEQPAWVHAYHGCKDDSKKEGKKSTTKTFTSWYARSAYFANLQWICEEELQELDSCSPIFFL